LQSWEKFSAGVGVVIFNWVRMTPMTGCFLPLLTILLEKIFGIVQQEDGIRFFFRVIIVERLVVKVVEKGSVFSCGWGEVREFSG
jgi:hypothetical protein